MAEWYKDLQVRLDYYIAINDLDNVIKALADGANVSKTHFNGYTPVGRAASKGHTEVLSILLQFCEEGDSFFNGRMVDDRPEMEMDNTPDGMDSLEWDDEINNDSDTGSETDKDGLLYRYYAETFERMGDTLTNLNNSPLRVDPHAADKFGYQPLHHATIFGYVDCVRVLLQYKAPVNCTTPDGETPLILSKGNEEIVRMLLSHGADPHRKMIDGKTALHRAAEGCLPGVELLLQAGANINELNNRDQTPLMLAIENDAYDIAYKLIEIGAKLNVADCNRETALYRAVMHNNVKLSKCLFEHGARLITSDHLLHKSVKFGHSEMVRLLVTNGDNVNVRDYCGYTPYFLAIFYSNPEMLEILLKNSVGPTPKIDRNSDILCLTVQYVPTADMFSKFARVLLTYGATLSACIDYRPRQTPLDRALLLRKYDIAEFLIKEGADPTQLSTYTLDTLRQLKNKAHLNIIRLLAFAGLDIYKSTKKDKCFNPMSLKDLARILIRKHLITNLEKPIANTNNYEESRLQVLCRQTGIPHILQRFICNFDDLPSDITNPIPFHLY